MMFDKELIRQLASIPSEDRASWTAEREKLESLASEMNRFNVKEMVTKYGIARVLRVLAATIKRNPKDFDSDVVEMANWIPPIRTGRDAEMWFCSTIHRAYIQDIFRQYANLRKL